MSPLTQPSTADEARFLQTSSGDRIQKTSQYIQDNKALNMLSVK